MNVFTLTIYSFNDTFDILPGRSRHENKEFITAISSNFITFTYTLSQEASEGLKNFISFDMPIFIIDILEIGHIYHKDRNRSPISFESAAFLVHPHEKIAPVP